MEASNRRPLAKRLGGRRKYQQTVTDGRVLRSVADCQVLWLIASLEVSRRTWAEEESRVDCKGGIAFVIGSHRQKLLARHWNGINNSINLLGKEFESFLTKFSATYQCFFTSSPFEILSVQDNKIRQILSCLAKKLGSCFITCFQTSLDPLTYWF